MKVTTGTNESLLLLMKLQEKNNYSLSDQAELSSLPADRRPLAAVSGL